MEMMTGYDKPLSGGVEKTNSDPLPLMGVVSSSVNVIALSVNVTSPSVGKVVTTLSVVDKRHESSGRGLKDEFQKRVGTLYSQLTDCEIGCDNR